MYSLRSLVSHLCRRLETCHEAQSYIRSRKIPSSFSRCISSRDGNDDEFDDLWDRPTSYDRKRSPNSSFHNSYGGNRHFRPSRTSNPNFHRSERSHRFRGSYDRDFLDDDDHDDDYFQRTSQPFERKELGAKIKKKEWGEGKLTPIEKNFYVEHPSVAERPEADVDAFYNSHNITVTRGERPSPVSDFTEANFPERINQQLEKNGWTNPTPIQSLGWPLALSGKNMVGIAQTGSGKTLGFILPALVHIKHQRQVTRGEGPLVLILAPTRELAQQIKHVAVEYGRVLGIRSCCIFGGQSKLIQARHISEGPEIVVATPGRLLDFLEMDVINLDRTSYVVLDEADRMLDMGFEPQIRKVLGQIRPDRQMLMWSATWPREIQQLAHDFLGDFTQVNIGSSELTANPKIKQVIKVCDRMEKFKSMVEELEQTASEEGPQKTLIFVQTKTQADIITHKLRKLRFRALSIHGDKTQLVRDKTLSSFRRGETQILVATDVASRGLDVDDIKLVVNFDYPNAADDYIHRIGRTARASKTGTAITFITDNDAGKVPDLIKVLRDSKQEVPVELTELAELHSKFGSRGPQKNRGYKKPYMSRGFNRRNSW